jgi:hypothetical protein
MIKCTFRNRANQSILQVVIQMNRNTNSPFKRKWKKLRQPKKSMMYSRVTQQFMSWRDLHDRRRINRYNMILSMIPWPWKLDTNNIRVSAKNNLNWMIRVNLSKIMLDKKCRKAKLVKVMKGKELNKMQIKSLNCQQ